MKCIRRLYLTVSKRSRISLTAVDGNEVRKHAMIKLTLVQIISVTQTWRFRKNNKSICHVSEFKEIAYKFHTFISGHKSPLGRDRT